MRKLAFTKPKNFSIQPLLLFIIISSSNDPYFNIDFIPLYDEYKQCLDLLSSLPMNF